MVGAADLGAVSKVNTVQLNFAGKTTRCFGREGVKKHSNIF